ncbi:MAG: WG repeat-containing protein [Lachnospiraceae bacterium]|nr:WG repeat-containing protein [Lachnospiraceae bacterium]
MKNYRNLFPPVLIILMVLSVYMASNNNIKAKKEYEDMLAKARECVEYGIIVDADVYYQEALSLKPSSELYVEYMNMYIDAEEYYDAQKIGKSIIDTYNDSVNVYETLSKAYYYDKDYDDFIELYVRYQDEGLFSQTMEDLYASIEYNITYFGSFLEVGTYSGGRCAVKTESGWGYVSDVGKKKIPYEYEWVGDFGNDIAPVLTKSGEMFFIDIDGNKKKVLNKIENVVAIGNVAQNIIPVYDGSTWSFYDMDQNFICGGYEEVSSMGNGYAAVKTNGKWQMINSSGEPITDELYEDIKIDDRGVAFRGCYFGKVEGFYYMYDENGERIVEQPFQDAKVFQDTEGYAAILLYNKWGFVNLEGEIVIEPEYDDARSFRKELAAVKIDGMWGYIDYEQNLVIDNIYTDARDFNDSGNAMVLVGDTWQLIKLLKYNY